MTRRPDAQAAMVWLRSACGFALVGATVAIVAMTAGPIARASARVATGSAVHVTARDRAAAVAYRKAELAYERAIVVAAPATKTSLEAVAGRFRGECPGVMDGVARLLDGSTKSLASPVKSRQTPKQRGEVALKRRQWSDLVDEAKRASELARDPRVLRAELEFARSVLALSWSDPAVTRFEHATAVAEEWEAQGTPPPVCSDMEAWAQSGYRSVTASTRAYAAEREAAARPIRRVITRTPQYVAALFVSPMSVYEGPRARVVSRRIEELGRQSQSQAAEITDAGLQVDYALGVTSEAELKAIAKRLGGESLPPNGAKVIGTGVTAAGGSYKAWIEPKGRRAQPKGVGGLFEVLHRRRRRRRRCAVLVGFQESVSSAEAFPAALQGRTGSVCVSSRHRAAPRVVCDAGVSTIGTQTLPGARRVTLLLDDGRRITSHVAVVPRKLGVPAGFYYQAVEGAGPKPVALIEVGASGKRLRTVKLRHVRRCVASWPLKEAPVTATIAGGAVHEGPSFSIFGSSERSTVEPPDGHPGGHREVSPQVELSNGGEAGGIQHGPLSTGPFSWSVKTGCEPHAFALVYGNLTDRSDTAWVKIGIGLEQLRRARIPPILHSRGVLAYAVLSEAPSELVLRGPEGKVVARQDLKRMASEARETCEGEAEASPGQ